MPNKANTGSNRSTAFAFILGGLVVLLAVLAYVMLSDTGSGTSLTISIEGEDTTVEKAAEAISGG